MRADVGRAQPDDPPEGEIDRVLDCDPDVAPGDQDSVRKVRGVAGVPGFVLGRGGRQCGRSACGVARKVARQDVASL